MGSSHGDFVKYPRTPHLFGSRGTADDKHLGERESLAFLADESLIGPSRFDSEFDNPHTGRVDNLMEGLYLRTEADGVVTGRAKVVRPEFVEKIKQSTHWQHKQMEPNGLADGADIWS